jgi:hypothetical protein
MKSNTILIGIATIIIAAGAYWYFFTGTGNQPPLSESGERIAADFIRHEYFFGRAF